MSSARRRILVVCDSCTLANNLLTWLSDAGYDVAIVTTFIAGKEHLRTAPDILITELKLREYNGLHLALRAHRDGIPTAVIGADASFAGDAEGVGASYLASNTVLREDIVLLIGRLLSAPAISQRSQDWHEPRLGPALDQPPPVAEEWWVESPVGDLASNRFPGRRLIH